MVLRRLLLQPALAGVLRDRRGAAIIASLVVAQLSLAWLDWSLWTCPSAALFSLPCPGCGITRAVLALFRGDVGAALRIHALAPLVAAMILVILTAALLPQRPRYALAAAVAWVERRTALMTSVGIAFLVYWAARDRELLRQAHV